ncbi:reverse transcriptase domain-containing protein [Tanacetum coccineum]
MSVRIVDRSFQYPIGIAKNMLVEVGKFTFPMNFVILEMEEDSKVPLILGRPFLHTANAVIHVKEKQLNLGIDFDALLDEDQEKPTFTCPFETYAYRRMPFGLCDAPATFQRCMLAIYYDMIKESVGVFMDNFSVFGNSFDNYLNNLDKMLLCCKDANLFLNWEKCHFMVKEGIVLGHKVSGAGLEVDKSKTDVISKLPPPLMLKELEVF